MIKWLGRYLLVSFSILILCISTVYAQGIVVQSNGEYRVQEAEIHLDNFYTVGTTVTDPVNDVSISYIDLTSITASADGTDLQVLMHFRDLPETIPYTGYTEHNGTIVLHFSPVWGIGVDIDNDSRVDVFVILVVATENGTVGGFLYPGFNAIEEITLDSNNNTIFVRAFISGLSNESKFNFVAIDLQSGREEIVDYLGSKDTPSEVPEPATIVLFGSGLATLFGYYRRKAKERISCVCGIGV